MVYIRNSNDMAWADQGQGKRYKAARKALTPHPSRDGGPTPGLGASLYRLPPGKRAWPRHVHMANDEAIYILAGKGTLLYGEEEYPVRPGDYIHLPAGGEAHQLRNSGEADLDYLCLSTMLAPEIVLYPDSGKAGIFAGSATGGDPAARRLFEMLPRHAVGYWDGETVD